MLQLGECLIKDTYFFIIIYCVYLFNIFLDYDHFYHIHYCDALFYLFLCPSISHYVIVMSMTIFLMLLSIVTHILTSKRVSMGKKMKVHFKWGWLGPNTSPTPHPHWVHSWQMLLVGYGPALILCCTRPVANTEELFTNLNLRLWRKPVLFWTGPEGWSRCEMLAM